MAPNTTPSPDPASLSEGQRALGLRLANIGMDVSHEECAVEAIRVAVALYGALETFTNQVSSTTLKMALDELRTARGDGTPAKIITSHVYPPIPDHSNDWCAYVDGTEEDGVYGWGATEQEAIDDLSWQLDDANTLKSATHGA